MENGLPKEDIVHLLNSQQVIKCHETTISEVGKGLRIDNDVKKGTIPSHIDAEFYGRRNRRDGSKCFESIR